MIAAILRSLAVFGFAGVVLLLMVVVSLATQEHMRPLRDAVVKWWRNELAWRDLWQDRDEYLPRRDE